MQAFLDSRARSRGPDTLWGRFLVCCFVGIWSLRAFFIARFCASVPLVHEWEATGIDTLGAWKQGTYTLEALFEPHNGDHPTVATRLWEIFWYTLNGSWDPKLVMFMKAGVFAGAATLFVHLLANSLGNRRYLAGCLVAALFAFPFNWHNLLWGVASQFDFLFFAAAAGWVALLSGAPWAAIGIGFAGLFTNGAGPLVCASFVPFLVWCMRERVLAWREGLPLTAVALVVVGIGISLDTPDAGPREGTVGQRAAMFFQLYAWPFSDALTVFARGEEFARKLPRAVVNFPSAETSWFTVAAETFATRAGLRTAFNILLGAAVLAPTCAWAILIWRRRVGLGTAAGWLGVASFALLMIAATAWARSQQSLIGVRFLDHVVLAGVVSVAASVGLVTAVPRCRRVLAGWAAVFAVGYAIAVGATLLQIGRQYPQRALEAVQRYYEGRDRAVLLQGEAYRALFFEDGPEEVFAILDAKALQPVLPRAVVAPTEPPSVLASVTQELGNRGLLLAFFASAGAAWCVAESHRREKARLAVPVPVVRT